MADRPATDPRGLLLEAAELLETLRADATERRAIRSWLARTRLVIDAGDSAAKAATQAAR